MSKFALIPEAIALVKDGMTIMVGGFMGCGGPDKLMHALSLSGVKDLTVICDDGGLPDFYLLGVHEIFRTGQVKHLITTHIGKNREVGQLLNAGKMKVSLVPQGTFVEKIRAGGYGLGGVLTPTGIGTPAGVGSEDAAGGLKESVVIDGREYLLERPLRADIAFIYGSVADKYGNVKIRGTARNFNTVMAFAADTVVCQADELVDMIDPDEVLIPGVLVDYIVGGKN